MTSMEEHFVHKDDNFIEFLLSSLSNHLIKSLNFIKFIKCRDHIYYLIYYSTYYFSFIVNDKFKSSYYVLQCQIVWVFEVFETLSNNTSFYWHVSYWYHSGDEVATSQKFSIVAVYIFNLFNSLYSIRIYSIENSLWDR